MAALTQNISIVPGIELSPQEANRYKNIFAVQVPMCEVFRAILNWECSEKQKGQTYADYFEQKKQQYEDRHAALVTQENNRFKLPKIGLPTSSIKMLQEEPSRYDVTLMFSYLFEIFKSKETYTNAGQVRIPSQLECLLKKAKDMRNDVMHEVAAGAVDPMKFDEIVKAMHDVIDEAGNVYNIPADEVTSFKAQIDGMWDEVRTDNEKAKAYSCFFLQTFGNKEAKVKWEEALSEETLLFGEDKVERSKVFHSLELTIQKPGLQAGRISYKELFSDTDKKFILVSGASGSGKSTLVKNLVIQFHGISDANVEMKNLHNFNLILIYECRNRSIEQFSVVVQQNFKNVCLKLGPETVVQAITHSNPLILVDGYDECHKDSFKVVDQLVDEMKYHECRVIITTRSSHVEELKNHLKQKLVTFQDYEISEISDIKDQMRFLEKYEKHVNPHAHEVVKTFSSLERKIQELFVNPIYLVLFCHLVWNFPERINNWTSHAEVAHDIYRLYKKMIESKLASYPIVDKDGLVNDFFWDVANFSLQTITENQLVFTEDQVGELMSSFRETLEKHGARGELDPKALVGVVLKIKRHLNDFDSCTYFFHHKSIQELFASKTVIKELRKNNCLPYDLQGVSRASLNLQGVLAYVLIELSAVENSNVFKRNWHRLKDAAKAAGADKMFWQKVLLNSPHSQLVAAETARVYLAQNTTWNIASDRDADTLALLMPHQQPEWLDVSRLNDPVPKSWRQVASEFRGILELRLFSEQNPLRPCDDVVEALAASSCSLSIFTGRVRNADSIQNLSKVARPGTEFNIYMEPHLDLTPLQHKHRELWVIVEPTFRESFVALPVSENICLRVKPVAENQQESLTRTILGLAPADNRLRWLEVRDCALTEAQLLETLAKLQRAGLRTLFRDQLIHGGPSRVLTIREKNFALILTDEPPLLPQAEPTRSPALLSEAPAVGGENLCPLASSCGDLDAVYRSLYALNVVLPHALRFVLKKICAQKPSQATHVKYFLSKCLPGLQKWLFLRIRKSSVREALEKRECESADFSPFDSLPLIQLVFELFDIRSSGLVDTQDGLRDCKKANTLVQEVKTIRAEVHSNMCTDPSRLAGLPDRITEIAYELISEAAELHRVPDAEAERVKEACQALCDKYSDVRVDDDAFAAYYVVKENWEWRALSSLKNEFAVRNVVRCTLYSWGFTPCNEFCAGSDTDFIKLQFFTAINGKIPCIFIHFECCDSESTNFSDVVERNFPASCSQIGAHNVEYVLTKLNPLIFFSSYDEANATSNVVVEETIYKFCKYPFEFVVTTRPNSTASHSNLIRIPRLGDGQLLPFALKYYEKKWRRTL
ncbi:uncharacterized protein LOC108681871 [Hyalella azteca]|uniref:Uncharacterized protein LOC108681871 n=1 Tax=Hyalella azteca TaxID=294128 RepID=A0A979FGE7_HYAAZ|nr:uncharacterized protein LOC108681871 [Hyalella azteca]